MATCTRTVDLEVAAIEDFREVLTREVRRGLIARPRSLSPWMFYDAEGSRLFERITALPEYHPTRTERAILVGNADAIIARAHNDRSLPLRLVELGAGTASKTCILLGAALCISDDVIYMPVDVCSDALELACENVASALPEVSIQRQLQAGDALLLGADMVKDESTLLAAYDDSDGITAAFNLDILDRHNRELGANIDAACFRYRMLWNSIESRIEMHLECTREQDVSIEDADLDLHFMPRETIHTENSYKFTDRSIRSLLNESGFEIGGSWRDRRGWYTLTLAGLW